MSGNSQAATSVTTTLFDTDAKRNNRIAWINVVIASVVMLATLPGRTQGLGLITEPLLRDLQLDRVAYANINLWATLLGAAFCLPAGWLIDRFGLRWVTSAIVLLLGAVVWGMSAMAGGVTLLFFLILCTRALGQSALSVASISAVGKSFGRQVGMGMGVYAVLLSVFFAVAFIVIGSVVTNQGWRVAWRFVAMGLLMVVAPLVMAFLRTPGRTSQAQAQENEADGMSLAQALSTPAFWVFGGATAFFGLVSSGLGLFNEAVLAERGFDQRTFHVFLAVTTMIALVGQFLCGWLSLRWTMQRLLGMAMLLYGTGLAVLPFLRTFSQLWVFAALVGLSAGFITVIFFAIWGKAYGHAHLGRIQGAAQMLTVFASAIGPLLFAKTHAATGSYTSILVLLSAAVLIFAVAAWFVKLPVLRFDEAKTISNSTSTT
jgi:MFS family permease